MPSDAEAFEDELESFKESVDDDGRHFYVMKFTDDSGRIFRKRPSRDDRSIADVTIRDMYAREGMRKISDTTDFEFDETSNTQQNLRKLMGG